MKKNPKGWAEWIWLQRTNMHWSYRPWNLKWKKSFQTTEFHVVDRKLNCTHTFGSASQIECFSPQLTSFFALKGKNSSWEKEKKTAARPAKFVLHLSSHWICHWHEQPGFHLQRHMHKHLRQGILRSWNHCFQQHSIWSFLSGQCCEDFSNLAEG